MGGKQSTMAERYSLFRQIFDNRVPGDLAKHFSSSGVVHFFNVQERRAIVFKGREEIEAFFHIYLQVFPVVSYQLDQEDFMDHPHGAKGKREDKEEKEDHLEEDEEEENFAVDAFSEESAKILSTFFDEENKTAVVEFKLPQKGYRFVQETLVCNSKGEWTLLSLTMDSATDFSGLADVTSPLEEEEEH